MGGHAFNRGRTGLPPADVEVVTGDRTRSADLEALSRGRWDLVVDTWSGAPRIMAETARILAGLIGRFGYVSSRPVYRSPPEHGGDETAPVVDADPDADASDYPRDKRGAEIAALRELGDDRVLLARAGLILGPREDVGRLPWWLRRVAEGEKVLAPGPADLPLQLVDARDLAAFMLEALEAGLSGPFDVVSRRGHTTMEGLLDACRHATGSRAELTWVEPDFLLGAGVEPWTELPIWVPPGNEARWVHTADTTKALRSSLRCRPIEETVADTWAWMRASGADQRGSERSIELGVGMARSRERELLSVWDSRR